MVFNAIVKSYTKITTTGANVTQALTGAGFTPKAYFTLWCKSTTTGTQNGISVGWGHSSGTTGFDTNCISGASQDAVGTSNTGKRRSESKSILYKSLTTTSVISQAETASYDTDGITLTWTTVGDTNPDRFLVAYFGGADLTNVQAEDIGTGSHWTTVGTFSETYPSIGGTDNITGLLSHGRDESTGTDAAHLQMALGAFRSATSRWILRVDSEDAIGTADTYFGASTTRAIWGTIATSGATDFIVDFSSFATATNMVFDVLDTAATTSPVVGYTLFRGLQGAVGTFAAATATGTQAVTTGIDTDFVILSTQNSTATQTVSSAGCNMAVGMAGTAVSDAGCIWFQDVDAQATSDCGSAIYTDAVLRWSVSTASNTFSAEATATMQSFDSSGFTLQWTDAPAAAVIIYYFALGPAPPPPPAIPPTLPLIGVGV